MLMVSFCSVLESMRKSERVGKNDDVETIEKGLGISDDFWENFIQMLHASKGLSKLLGVSEDSIATWQQKIETAIAERKKALENKPINKNNKLI